MKISISRSQWESMGRQAGWMKESGRDFIDNYKTVRQPGVRPSQAHDDKRPIGPIEEEIADLETLKNEANEIALARGHMLGEWQGNSNDCVKCGRRVLVTENPKPNEIDIVGDAVSVNCDPEPFLSDLD